MNHTENGTGNTSTALVASLFLVFNVSYAVRPQGKQLDCNQVLLFILNFQNSMV
jgi:hypothetical protein